MTQREEDQEHQDLQRLFDATGSEASGPTLTKLAARAADIPERARQKQRFLPAWAWGTAFAGAVAVLGGLVAVRAVSPRAVSGHAPELGSSTPTTSLTVATASAREAAAAAPLAVVTTGEEASDSPELLEDADEGARFEVSGPQSDRDLDAWLAATKELSGGT